MAEAIQFAVEHKAVILGFLFAASEALALVPSIKSSSVFQLVFNLVKKAAGK